jgi:aspartyl-tRNA(Asn)/glutamyl-tRNA(Gln) amidotransferase subunit A
MALRGPPFDANCGTGGLNLGGLDLAGVPAICVPCGFSADGLRYSLQLTGRRLSEAMLCRVAFAYEQATDWRRRHPPVQS